MVVGAKVCELTDGFLWFVCGLYVGILTSPLTDNHLISEKSKRVCVKDFQPFTINYKAIN